jgi:hypothetical protein
MSKENESLKNFLVSRKVEEYNRVCNLIIDGCYITRQTLYNWRKGRTPISVLCKEKINQIAQREFGEKVFSDNNSNTNN